MSEHSQIVREYVELRNYLAQSNPEPNMPFEVHFKIIGNALVAFNTVTKTPVEMAKIQPQFFHLYSPHYGLRFEKYSFSLITFINTRLKKDEIAYIKRDIVSLAGQHRKSLGLKEKYEPLI